MKNLFILLIILFAFKLNAQNLIARHSDGDVNFYEDLEEALTDAIDGDTLYLPGKSFVLNFPITMEVHLIGAGADIDSALVTNKTVIYSSSSTIEINSGATFSSYEGIRFDNDVSIGGAYVGAEEDLHDILFKNCFFGNLTIGYSGGGVGASPVINITMINCNLSVLYNFGSNHAFYNTIFRNGVTWLNNCFAKNCVFLVFLNAYNYNSIFENCIFATTSLGIHDSYCTYTNFVTMGCCTEFGVSNEFINWNYCASLFSFDTDAFYELADDCEGKGGGTDGKDIGIYGGDFSWKKGMIPSNPHMYYKNIPDVSNEDGTLDVNIKVSAQDN
ncbi:MAG: hypothetical protein WAT52_06000 [Chitinophagales bacterium]